MCFSSHLEFIYYWKVMEYMGIKTCFVWGTGKTIVSGRCGKMTLGWLYWVCNNLNHIAYFVLQNVVEYKFSCSRILWKFKVNVKFVTFWMSLKLLFKKPSFFWSDKARLCLFGSSKNGFGFRDSDLDICMTLEGHENAEVFYCFFYFIY